jgi:hypothetical protein
VNGEYRALADEYVYHGAIHHQPQDYESIMFLRLADDERARVSSTHYQEAVRIIIILRIASGFTEQACTYTPCQLCRDSLYRLLLHPS